MHEEEHAADRRLAERLQREEERSYQELNDRQDREQRTQVWISVLWIPARGILKLLG